MYGVISRYINDPYSAYAYKQISKTHRKYSPKMKCKWDNISNKIIEQIDDLYDLSNDYWNDSKHNINNYFRKYFFRVDRIYENQMVTPMIVYSVSRKDSQHILDYYEQEKENTQEIPGYVNDRDRFNFNRLSEDTALLIYENQWTNNNNKYYELDKICNSIYILPSSPIDLRKIKN